MLRNKELRQMLLLFAAVTAGSAAAGFAVHPAAGGLLLLSACAYCTLFLLFTRARYRKIAQAADQIDRVLHNDERLYINDFEEGELSVLHSEITKMTVRIREQNDALRREKQYLADSLADIAHQLRTPLTSVNLLLSRLKNASAERERRGLVRETEDLLHRMDWLITALLKLAQLDASVVEFRTEAVPVRELVESALQPFLILMELRDVVPETDIPDSMRFPGDPVWLSEALQNICKNCIESMDRGGKLEITGSDNLLYTELVIHDSGPGFAEEDLPRLFDRFYRGKSTSAAGYGIGLPLSRSVITRQGGTLTAKNHPQGGAVFAIRFQKHPL